MPNFNKNDFSGNPVRLDTARSKFAMPFKHKTTFSAGKLIPIFSYGDVLPGDTFKVDMSALVRMATPVFPTMDDAYLDVYFFFTPHKLVLSRQSMSPAVNDSTHSWSAFIGAQDSLLNMPTPSEVQLPMLALGEDSASVGELGSLTDYLGIGVYGCHGANYVINALEPLAYYSIWNNYFRDENTQNPVVYSIGSAQTSSDPDINGRSFVQLSGGPDSADWGTDGVFIGGKGSIMPVCPPHGYFGSALPWPQRNLTQVEIPLLGSADVFQSDYEFLVGGSSGAQAGLSQDHAIVGDDIAVYNFSSTPNPQEEVYVRRGALKADLSTASGVAINQLRLLVQTQRFYEALARGGNRIGEMTATMFGVTPADYAQDRPEYLGGKRIPISMDQVANTAGPSAGVDPDEQTQTLGSLGAYSNTGDSSFYFEKSFDTWGTITCVICVRTNESFSQGLPRRYSRKTRMDLYWPQYANLGEQPVLKREAYIKQIKAPGYEVFGYQEAWAEYRYLPDIVSGHLRPNSDLGSYTYANFFTDYPTLAGYLSGKHIPVNVDRTLIVGEETSGFQFIGDFSFNIIATRPMPRYSIPGLVDHH